MDYLKAGYPILFDDKVLYANEYKKSGDTTDYNKWSYVDFNSKLYHFVEAAKVLGYDATIDEYTGKDEDGNEYWHGKLIPKNEATIEEQEELKKLLSDIYEEE